MNLPTIQLFSVSIIQEKHKKFYSNKLAIIEIINEIEQELPGLKEELLDGEKIRGQYIFLVEEVINFEKIYRHIKNINELVTVDSKISIFSVIDAG